MRQEQEETISTSRREPDKIYYDELKQNNIDKNFHLRILKRGLYPFSTVKTIINSKESKDKLKIVKIILLIYQLLQIICAECEDIILSPSLLMDVTDNELDIDLQFYKTGIKKQKIKFY